MLICVPTGQGADDNRDLLHQMVSPVLYRQSQYLEVFSAFQT